MSRALLKQILNEEMGKHEKMAYDELLKIHFPFIYEVEYNGQEYSIEMEILEQKDEYLNIGFIINSPSETKFINQMFPVSSNIIIDK